MRRDASAADRHPVTFVGAGPGEPGLATVRGRDALAAADVVVFDAAVPAALLDAAPEGAERLRVGAPPDAVPPSAVPPLLRARVEAGLRVVRLLAGDGGQFGPEADALAAAGLAFEAVPGVTGPLAAAVCAGVALGPPGPGRSPVIVDGTDPALALGRPVALAEPLLAGVTETTVGAVVAALLEAGRDGDTPAALIAGVATPRQRTVTGPLRSVVADARDAGLAGPLVLVVGEAVRSRGRLAWLERRPLHGRRVVVTRPRGQVGRLAALLEAEGAEVLAVPTIRLEPPDDWGPLDRAIARLSAFDWVVFTSANGVAAFRERLARAGRDARALGGARLAAIGPETARALEAAGLVPDVVPPEFRAEGLVEALDAHVGTDSEVLLVRAAEAREVLPQALGRAGARVTVAPAYRTVAAKEGADAVLRRLEAREVDVVTFTSSSTVHGFMALVPSEERRRLLAGVVLAAIGPITAATLAEHGLEARVVPRQYTVAALTTAIAAHFDRRA